MSDRETVFTLEATPVKFGPGAADDAGWELARLGVTRALLVTDPGVAAAGHPDRVRAADRGGRHRGRRLRPARGSSRRWTSLEAAAAFARDARVDGFVSVGGGSAIDTAKVADLVVSHPAPVMDYVNAPVGGGPQAAAPLRPHLAIPTTSGTGSEATTVAVLDLPDLRRQDRHLAPLPAPGAGDRRPGARRGRSPPR